MDGQNNNTPKTHEQATDVIQNTQNAPADQVTGAAIPNGQGMYQGYGGYPPQGQVMYTPYGYMPMSQPQPDFMALTNQMRQMQASIDKLANEKDHATYVREAGDQYQTEKLTQQTTRIVELQDENSKLRALLALRNKQIEELENKDWNEENWKMGQILNSTLHQTKLPEDRPPHLRNDFPQTCAKCGKGIWQSEDVYDDLFPLLPYDGETVYCKDCFTSDVLPERMECARRVYRASKEQAHARYAVKKARSEARQKEENATAGETTEA